MLVDISDRFLKKIHEDYYPNMDWNTFMDKVRAKSVHADKMEESKVGALKDLNANLISTLRGIEVLLAKDTSIKDDALINTLTALLKKQQELITEFASKEIKTTINVPDVIVPQKPTKWCFRIKERDVLGHIDVIEAEAT